MYESQIKMQKGFTLIEIILVIAIISILSVSVFTASSRFLITNHLDNSVNNLISSLRTAQINAMNTKGDGNWGVKIENKTITLFFGESYSSRNSVYDETFKIPASVSVADTEVVFEKVTGDVSSQININLSDNTGSTAQVSINQEGIVNEN